MYYRAIIFFGLFTLGWLGSRCKNTQGEVLFLLFVAVVSLTGKEELNAITEFYVVDVPCVIKNCHEIALKSVETQIGLLSNNPLSIGLLGHSDSGAVWYFCTSLWLLHFLLAYNLCFCSTLVVNKSFM